MNLCARTLVASGLSLVLPAATVTACTPGTLGRNRDPDEIPAACANGIDDDGDGLADDVDPGCQGGATDDDESLVTFTDFYTDNTAVTVLFVIDDSGTMCEEQANLRANLSFFFDAFRFNAPLARYHMGVVSTDTSNTAVAGRLRSGPSDVVPSFLCPAPAPAEDCTTGLPSPLPKFIDENTPDGQRILRCNASAGIMGFGAETPLGAARMALSPPLLADPMANAGFFVPGSLLMVVFLGDEDDCSVCSGASCSPLPGIQFNLDCSINRVNELTPIADFVSYFENIPTGDGSLVSENGIFVSGFLGLDANGLSAGPTIADPSGADGLVPICSVAGQGSAAPAPRVDAFIRSFDFNSEHNVCDANYSAELSALGTQLGELMTEGCFPVSPCEGITLANVVVTADGATVSPIDLVLRPDPGCAGGWSLLAPDYSNRTLVITYPAGPGACP